MVKSRQHRAAIVAAVIAASGLLVGPTLAGAPAVGAPGQIEAGALATWADLSTWNRPAAGRANSTEHGLGLVLNGENGQMRLAFYVVRANREPAASRPIMSVGVRAAAGARLNPNLIRRPTLSLTFGDRGGDPEVVDLSQSMTVDNPAPGAAVSSGVGSMPAQAFARMAGAEEISADIFGALVVFRSDQVAAVDAFRERFFPQR